MRAAPLGVRPTRAAGLAVGLVTVALSAAPFPAMSDECPFPDRSGAAIAAVKAAPSCRAAAEMAKDCCSGGAEDLALSAGATAVCERDFLSTLDPGRRETYDRWRASCERTDPGRDAVHRSDAAFCAAAIAERYSAEMLDAARPAGTSGWSRYTNDRFGYAFDVPPGFTAVREAENGDGGRSGAVAGRADLAAWGAYLIDAGFGADVRSRMNDEAASGWVIG